MITRDLLLRLSLLFFFATASGQLLNAQPETTSLIQSASTKEDSKDDSAQKGITCPENTFQCDSNRCIPLKWRCDSESDCEKGEDELKCSPSTQQCNPEKEYKCSMSKQGSATLSSTSTHLMNLYGTASLFSHHCIPKALHNHLLFLEWRCDGEADCVNKDDEESCEKITCNNQTHFQCQGFDTSSPSCIPKEWVCDGQTDCLDMEDEKHCESKSKSTCDTSSEFTCNDGLCIYKSWRCDGDNDCVDGSDEAGCDQTCEKLGKFKCKTGFCIPPSWRCDGESDCTDHSDELDCEHTTLTHNVTCSDKEFKCKNGAQCISSYWVCDGDFDCFDESDERDCKSSEQLTCNSTQQLCSDGKVCVDKDLVCDGNEDCSDGSDERNCRKTDSCDKDLEYQCPEEPQRCIKYSDICKNGFAYNDCVKTICNKEISNCNATDPNCECRKTGTKGKVCNCLSGMKNITGKCTDVDECATRGVCDQICENTFRSYKCDCHPGYKLTAGDDKASGVVIPHKCRAVGDDPMLLLSNRRAIRQYDIVTNKYHPLINSLESAVAMDFWHKNNTLIWSDVAKQKIMICHLGNQTMLNDIHDCLDHENVTLIDKEVITPDGLAIDWVHGLLFWTDTGLDRISVFDLNTKRRKTLFQDHLEEPRAIAVDPTAGLIFWSDWGARARIERAGMNGENRVEIISGGTIRWPNGLAVDILDRRVYWADAKMKLISSCDYWGKDVRPVIHSHQHLRHPFSLAVFEEKLYWTDWDQEGVLTVNKFRGNDVKTLMKGISGPMTVRVYHEQAQPRHENKCEFHDCEHLCLPRAMLREAKKEMETDIIGRSYSCSCDMGFKVNVENTSMCIPIEAIIGVLPIEDSPSGIPLTYLLMGAIVAFVLILGVLQYRSRRPSQFSVLHFDNPIYRRTVEDLDGDLENPVHDNTLGAISILPISVNGGGQAQNEKHDPTAKLVMGTKNSSKKIGSSMVDMSDPTQYAYDQPANGGA